MKHQYKVIIIGSGFGGQLAAINLVKEGISDFFILERRDYMGGTWCQNVYPGAAVDVPSPLYALSYEPFDWTQMYAEQDELSRYTNFIIEKYKLREKTATSQVVTKIHWSELDQVWTIEVAGKAAFRAQFVINATGPLSTPVIPSFKGRDSFKGKSFHSNNWDTSYDYKNKRVAVIGSGASAAQIIPAIASQVAHLSVFQRAAHWVMPRNDYVFKAWQRAILRNKWGYKILRVLIYCSLEYRLIGFKYSQKLLNIIGRGDAQRLIRKHIKDPELQKKVTPDFAFGCKRVILSDTLFKAYCRDNVSLYDKTNAIKKMTEKGIVTADDVEHELDLIVYSTGYDATDGIISYPVVGRGEATLAKVWEDYPRGYLGTMVPSFPNLFIVTGPNTGVGHTSALVLIESQMIYIMKCFRNLTQFNKKVIEVKASAEEKYTNHIHEEMKRTVWHTGGCNSWYKSKSGKIIAMFPGFSFTFRRWAKNFKAKNHNFF
ncbi:MAG: monooxygenase [Gammaproteobacteria bacterium]|nr:MAG: monooxygenase [Gammaproteobacteria bacterium]